MKKHLFVLSALCLTLSIVSCGKKNNSSQDSNSTPDNNSIINTSISSGEKNTSSTSSVASTSSIASTFNPDDSLGGKVDLDTGSGSFIEKQGSGSGLKDNVQDGVILHAWNWSMNNIKDNMAKIAEAGYTTIQTSPMQPQKDYYPGNTAKDGWWKLYQPLGFSIATKDNEIGTKSDLIAMVQEADKYGIKVIVDVVANHLATDSPTKFSSGVKNYEPTIYGKDGTRAGGALIHEGSSNGANDSSAYSVTNGNIGLTDLDTSSPHVQQRVLSLLKEYIDCGVDGFRFDAAKHIETPDDGANASSFWTTVLNGATSYAISKGEETPYYYGEILNTPGNGRSFSSYTKMMSITDNKTGNSIRSAIESGNASSAASSSYQSGQDPSKIVLWGESHDTYSNDDGESKNATTTNVNKAYAMVASRAKATSLYFARPSVGPIATSATKLGAIGITDWRNKAISAVNHFHNYFSSSSEALGSSGDFAYNVRYDDAKSGMVLVNVKNATSVSSVTINSNMKDGSYKDQVSGNTFTVASGKVSGTMDASGIAVLYNDDGLGLDDQLPTIKASVSDGTFNSDNYEITYSIYNAKSATMKVGDSEPVSITSGAKLTLKDFEKNQSVKVVIKAVNEEGKEVTKTFTYVREITQVETVRKIYFTANNVASSSSTIYIHVWNSQTEDSLASWPGTAMTYLELNELNQKVYTFDIDLTKYDSIIFNGGKNSWQTCDILLKDGINVYYLDGGTSQNGFGSPVYTVGTSYRAS